MPQEHSAEECLTIPVQKRSQGHSGGPYRKALEESQYFASEAAEVVHLASVQAIQRITAEAAPEDIQTQARLMLYREGSI